MSVPATTIFLNGQFLTDPVAARLSAFDAGLQHAVGLFETVLGGHSATGEPWAHGLDGHIDRLCASAEELGLSDSLNSSALQQAVMATLVRSGLPRARIRLTLTAGDLNMLTKASAQAALGEKPATMRNDPTILIVAQPATTYPAPMFDRGVGVTLADSRANPLNPFEGHKTLNYWWRLRELQIAAAKGAAESLVLSITNHLVGGCVSNIFIVKDDALLTPIARGEEGRSSNTPDPAHAGSDDRPANNAPTGPRQRTPGAAPGARFLPSPTLPGVTRQWAIDTAELAGLKVKREMLSITDLLNSDEVLLTNSSWGVLPVVRVEKSDIGPGKPGRVTGLLRSAWERQTLMDEQRT